MGDSSSGLRERVGCRCDLDVAGGAAPLASDPNNSMAFSFVIKPIISIEKIFVIDLGDEAFASCFGFR